eukprot:338433-Chlamydomonas_euryale.AAC.1
MESPPDAAPSATGSRSTRRREAPTRPAVWQLIPRGRSGASAAARVGHRPGPRSRPTGPLGAGVRSGEAATPQPRITYTLASGHASVVWRPASVATLEGTRCGETSSAAGASSLPQAPPPPPRAVCRSAPALHDASAVQGPPGLACLAHMCMCECGSFQRIPAVNGPTASGRFVANCSLPAAVLAVGNAA